jgi:hypothetical protein
MTRFNAISKFAGTPSFVWGKNVSAILFAALLIVCSITVGCSSDKPKPANSTSQVAVTQNPISPVASSQPAPMPEPAKPAAKKVVRKRPATVTYSDKTYGVSFDYPRRYAIETGDAANDLVASSPLPLNFVQPGGIALAAVELPETSYANTDFSSAFFNVSVHKALSAEQCGEFSVPAPKPTPVSDSSAQPASPSTTTEPQGSKLMLGDMELCGTEAVSGEGTRQSDAKYFHVFQNGACYEFALNVTTTAREEAGMKHVDRDKVFARLEQILATVKINPITPASEEGTAPAASVTPAIPTTEASTSAVASTPAAPATQEPAVTPTAPQTFPQ